ncbi:MAG TPA: hypothetical protein VFE72_00605 [Lysobacter sp.]|nr:hypothetical protein [Lysobacter sp.]
MTPPTPRTSAILFGAVLFLGLVAAAAMALTEGEPGALPLGLVLVGLIGSAWVRWRSRRR